VNLKQIQALSDTELNIRIAELLGWERFPDKANRCGHEYWAQFKDGHFCTDTQERDELPNYCTDLNAMHEAENNLTGPQQGVFGDHLDWIAQKKGAPLRWMWNATARQRAEAFVLTMKETT
tara:strand:+ start:4962 stop:5324 length:363 start_codon:yes stop_codon:yes gene_type:complete